MMPPCKQDIQAVWTSDLFDSKWYLETYPDVKLLGMDPAEHYLWFGARLNRNPSPDFNSQKYLESNAEAAKNGLNPLLHCIRMKQA